MAKTKNPIPPGIHTVTPYLMVKDARKAIQFYKEAFGAEEVTVMEIEGKVMHANIKIGDSHIFMSEECPEMGKFGAETRGFATSSLLIYVTDVDGAFEKAVKAGCKVGMPVGDMFWGDRYCHVTDPFGQEWSIATHKEDLTPEEIAANFKEAMKNMAACASK
ncbi:MAG: VOC family protein [Cyanobacteria bacterium SZAS-4]|nr:VOC family protein [Cyanobacteria bacterium SZAS-4]